MSEAPRPQDIAAKRVVYELPGAERVRLQRDLVYRTADDGPLTMDLYRPPDADEAARLPAVIVVAGFPDRGYESKLGCKFKDMGSSVSWARLVGASGLAAITYTNREPAADLQALLHHLGHNAASLGIDATRIGLWASSGNVPLALSVLMQGSGHRFACAVLCYGFMLDLDGFTTVAEASRTWGFANPGAGRSVDDLQPDTPLFVARAGQDQFPHLNDTLDRFVVRALAANRPLTLVNHASGPHAFDLFHDSETTRAIVRLVLAFLQIHLLLSAGGC